MPKAKKFIDRKKAVTFNLVHRSQRDPLIADETAPQRVLVPINANVPTHKDDKPLSKGQRLEEQRKYGIYYDDDYNYMQHLKDSQQVCVLVPNGPTPKSRTTRKKKDQSAPTSEQVSRLNLPSAVFPSQHEDEVGMLNKAAPQGLCLELDPEVVAALDEDFDFDNPDNELPDNFMELAMAEDDEDVDDESDASGSDDDSQRAMYSDDYDGDSDGGNQMPRMRSWDAEETKSRFSQYSMTSSVIRRNQGLTMLDDRFEKMYGEYDDTELGPLDCEDIEGHMTDDHQMLLRAAEEFEKEQTKFTLDKARELARIGYMERINEEEDSSSSVEDLMQIVVPTEDKWDCETVLSTYSNLYNHPKLIEEPKSQRRIVIDSKTGIPKDVLGNQSKLTAKSLSKLNASIDANDQRNEDDDSKSVLSTLSVLSIRPKGESIEEKRDRKRLLKEYRRERRIEKKINQEAFKEEKKLQEKIMINNRNNVQGNKIL